MNELLWANADPSVRIAAIKVAMGMRMEDVVRRFELDDDEISAIPALVTAYVEHSDYEGWLKSTGWKSKPWGGIEGTDFSGS